MEYLIGTVENILWNVAYLTICGLIQPSYFIDEEIKFSSWVYIWSLENTFCGFVTFIYGNTFNLHFRVWYNQGSDAPHFI